MRAPEHATYTQLRHTQIPRTERRPIQLMYENARKYGLLGTDAMVYEALVYLCKHNSNGRVRSPTPNWRTSRAVVEK